MSGAIAEDLTQSNFQKKNENFFGDAATIYSRTFQFLPFGHYHHKTYSIIFKYEQNELSLDYVGLKLPEIHRFEVGHFSYKIHQIDVFQTIKIFQLTLYVSIYLSVYLSIYRRSISETSQPISMKFCRNLRVGIKMKMWYAITPGKTRILFYWPRSGFWVWFSRVGNAFSAVA